MTDLWDDYGDLITIKTDPLATGKLGGGTMPPAVLVTFYDNPFATSDKLGRVCMRLSGERLAAFTEAIGRHADYLAALASGSDDE